MKVEIDFNVLEKLINSSTLDDDDLEDAKNSLADGLIGNVGRVVWINQFRTILLDSEGCDREVVISTVKNPIGFFAEYEVDKKQWIAYVGLFDKNFYGNTIECLKNEVRNALEIFYQSYVWGLQADRILKLGTMLRDDWSYYRVDGKKEL